MEKAETSVFVDTFPDGERSRYELHASEVYKLMNEMRFASQRNHVEYGKWLIASMLAIHGGAIYAIGNMRNGPHDFNPDQLDSMFRAVGWNIVGICFIMLAGFMAWLNFQFAERMYGDWTNPAMLYRRDAWPGTAPQRTNPVDATLFLAAAFGGVSGFAFVAAATNIYQALH